MERTGNRTWNNRPWRPELLAAPRNRLSQTSVAFRLPARYTGSYRDRMIRSCGDRVGQQLLDRKFSRKFQAIEKTARVRLALLDAATSLRDLNLPGLHLEVLKGDRKGQHSIRINDQFRICFDWRDGDAYNVEIVDYR